MYIHLQDIFKVWGSGIVTSCDGLVIDFEESVLLGRLKGFAFSSEDAARRNYRVGGDTRDWKFHKAQQSLQEAFLSPRYVRDIHYRPFDIRRIYYTPNDSGLLSMPRHATMRHMCGSFQNIGLVATRDGKAQAGLNVLVSEAITELKLFRYACGAVLFPVYRISEEGVVENITPKCRTLLDQHYGVAYSALDILHYLYAFLSIRSTVDAQNRDFPVVFFVKDRKVFEEIAKVGAYLVNLHRTLSAIRNDEVHEDWQAGDDTVQCVAYLDGRVYINGSQYFKCASMSIFLFKIGGYCVVQHYLEARKGRVLSAYEISHVYSVIDAISKTLDVLISLETRLGKYFKI